MQMPTVTAGRARTGKRGTNILYTPRARTWMLLRESISDASTLVRSASGSLNTPPSLPLCRSRCGPATCPQGDV